MNKENIFQIKIYLDNGIVFEYAVDSAKSAREHSDAIIKGGYRHNDGNGLFEHYPPHRINKIKVTGGVIPTKYVDEVSGT